MAYGKTKPSMEPQSAEKLTEELNKYKELQETMKGVNAYWRKTGICIGAPGITEERAVKIDERIVNARYEWDRAPYSSYELTNNNSQIKRLEQKLAEVSRGFEGWEFEGGRAEANADMNRLQLFFDEKPNEQQRTVLKANGFKWAPSQDAWQRQLNDNRNRVKCAAARILAPFFAVGEKFRAVYAANRIDFIKPSDGRTVREHQPKPPARDAGAR